MSRFKNLTNDKSERNRSSQPLIKVSGKLKIFVYWIRIWNRKLLLISTHLNMLRFDIGRVPRRDLVNHMEEITFRRRRPPRLLLWHGQRRRTPACPPCRRRRREPPWRRIVMILVMIRTTGTQHFDPFSLLTIRTLLFFLEEPRESHREADGLIKKIV